jgi:two-component system KDP operon response regulator KdpE
LNPPAENDKQGSPEERLGLDVDRVRELSHQKLALIVDDDEDTVSLLKLTLRRDGINVVSATSGQEALKVAAETHPDIILLDIMMPGMDGWETLAQLKHFTNVPTLILSAILHEDAVVRAFEQGAVDYIKKPYSHKEIVARIQAILNRAAPPELHNVMVLPKTKIMIDFETHLVRVDDQPVKLSPQEYAVLEILAQHAESPVPYEEIAGQVWGEYGSDIHNRLKWVVHTLRKKMAQQGAPEEFISNYQRFGYLLQDMTS